MKRQLELVYAGPDELGIHSPWERSQLSACIKENKYLTTDERTKDNFFGQIHENETGPHNLVP